MPRRSPGVARFQRYRHADPEDLSQRLGARDGPALVVTDGVFSMDGDIAPLPALADVAKNAEILGPVAEHHRAVEFRVAADVVVVRKT